MKYTREERKEWVARWMRSKLSKADFCRRHGLEVRRFYGWFDQIKLSKTNSKETPSTLSPPVHPFSKVIVEPSADTIGTLSFNMKVHTDTGIKLSFEKGMTLSTLTQVIKALNTCSWT